MVSKVAVVALVAIVACPILLGYAMNLEQTAHSEYVESKDPLDVTKLLRNSVTYSYAHGDIYQLNTNMGYDGTNSDNKVIPVYNSITPVQTSYPLVEAQYNNLPFNNFPRNVDYNYFYQQWNYNPVNVSCNIAVYGMVNGTEQQLQIINNIHSFTYDKATSSYTYDYYYTSGPIWGINHSGVQTGQLTTIWMDTGGNNIDNTYIAQYSGNRYVDLSKGFYFKAPVQNKIVLPEGTGNVLFSVNLNSITNANYSVPVGTAAGSYVLQKTTTGSTVKWQAIRGSNVIDLYYDPNRSDNTYQIYMELVKRDTNSTYYFYTSHNEFRYVGGWPSSFGPAESFITYTDEFESQYLVSGGERFIDSINFLTNSSSTIQRTPTIRVDDAYFRAFEIQVLENVIYNPSSFRENPITRLSDIRYYGDSLVFGGNQYKVKDGNITLGIHEMSVKNLSFSSTYSNGKYQNKINDIVVSETIGPSNITFNGYWSANVITDSMTLSTYNSTEWTPGEFAWDGLDQNFLMIGLLAALGVFIALGIAYRKVKSALFALLVVCGGAVLLFFTML